MKIAICGSLNFTKEIHELATNLRNLGFEVQIPLSCERILSGDFCLETIKKEKEEGTFSSRAIKFDSIREYWNKIDKSDAILVANFDKNNIANYIGGNTFLEIGFAHILNKKIFLLNQIPELNYKDEIEAMQPIILNKDLSKIL